MGAASRGWFAPTMAMSPLVQATVAMYVGGFVLLTASLVTWQPAMSPRWLIGLLSVVSLVLGTYVVLRGARFTPGEGTVMAALAITAICALTSNTEIDLRALSNGAVLPLLGFYAAWFLDPRTGRAVIYTGCVAWMVAVVLRDSSLLTWLSASLVVQVVVGVELLARIRANADRLASVDTLTGAYNRHRVTETCGRLFGRLRARGTPFSIIALDLDGLRTVNNESGHQAGDDLLVEAVRHWQSVLRPGDLLGRTGGDEFVIVLPGADALAALAVKRRLREGATVSWSAGVAQARSDDDLATLMHRADGRMYRQKAERALDPDRT